MDLSEFRISVGGKRADAPVSKLLITGGSAFTADHLDALKEKIQSDLVSLGYNKDDFKVDAAIASGVSYTITDEGAGLQNTSIRLHTCATALRGGNNEAFKSPSVELS